MYSHVCSLCNEPLIYDDLNDTHIVSFKGLAIICTHAECSSILCDILDTFNDQSLPFSLREYAQVNLAMLRNRGRKELNLKRTGHHDFSLSFEDLENLLAIDQSEQSLNELDLDPIANFDRFVSVNCDPTFINNSDFTLKSATK